MKKICAIIAAASMGLIAACGGGSSSVQGASVAGVVADGYLQNALVFMDKNNNYQLDSGEPSATTDADGKYTLTVDPGDVGKYPIVAIAVAGQTIDQDTKATVTGTYVLCTPGNGVSGTVSNFISPISTLLREKMEANPGMTLADATVALRNQLNMPAGMNILGDYVAGGKSGNYTSAYGAMHQTARQMAGLMGSQAGMVVNTTSSGTTTTNVTRFRGMMGTINENLPQIAANAGSGMSSPFMASMLTLMQTRLAGIPTTSFMNFSASFRNMTGARYFWNYSGGAMQPRSGMMGSSRMF